MDTLKLLKENQLLKKENRQLNDKIDKLDEDYHLFKCAYSGVCYALDIPTTVRASAYDIRRLVESAIIEKAQELIQVRSK